jgi:glycosyl hydrolase family 106( putative alpha-L-rhamnosidase)
VTGPAWPAPTSESRPWAIWWWPGSAVDDAEIEAHLRRYAAAGLGGVQVVPIYGVRGAEDRFLPYLGEQWIERLRFTVRAARGLGLGVDLSTGTGWPFGGPQVTEADGSRAAIIRRFVPGADGRLAEPVRGRGRLVAVTAHPGSGADVDLTSKVDAATGRLGWIAPSGGWELFALFEVPTGMMVKRAPGGEGRVIDHLSPAALGRYLDRFDRAFGARPPGVRAFCNDSFEDMGSDFSADFLAAFAARRGYDLRLQLPALAGQGDADQAARVLADYRETVSDLMLDGFTRPWVAWAHRQGALAHDQAHGSPANLLDLYAAADVPQTEAFGPGPVDILFSKLASSAGHLAGRRLVSSETATWLGEHFQVAPSQVKPELDQLFLAGINHVFFHGATYSPADAPWPGWLFYAATDFGPESGFWPAMPALSAYVTRIQSALQAATPDRDLLLYFPVHDSWQLTAADAGRRLLHFTAHDASQWLHHHPTGLGQVAEALLAAGVMFDFASDRLLDGAAGTILVPGARLMPLETWARLRRLAEGGATVVFVGRMPEDVPGLGALVERRRQLRSGVAALGPGDQAAGARRWPLGRGRFILAPDLGVALRAAGTRRERLANAGLGVLRQRTPDGHLYFLASSRAYQGWAPLAVPAAAALVVDPLTGQQGLADLRPGPDGTEVFLALPPGTSLLVRTFDRPQPGPRWRALVPTEDVVPLTAWQLSFTSGGPVLPPPARADGPRPWTELDGEAFRSFSGTAVYRTEVERPAGAGPWILEAAGVHATAVVRVNGAEAGRLWALPFALDVTTHLRPGRNTLEVAVTSLPANRIAAQARAGVPRVHYHDIDFVDIQYRPFDPSHWEPLPSGLSGPVLLRRYREGQPR